MPLHDFISLYVEETEEAAWIQGENSRPDTQQLVIQLRKCQLDIFLAAEHTWATRLLARTGSKSHNIWLATQAQKQGWHWNPNEGLTRPRGLGWTPPIETPTEQSIYAALGLDYREPTNRDL